MDDGIAYIRVSTERQDKNFSKPTQIEGIRALAKRHECKILEVFEDSESGAAYPRPGLTALLEYVKAHKIKYVYVYAVDRLARDMDILGVIRYQLRQLGAEVRYVLREYDNDARGKLLQAVDGFQAQDERDKIAERMLRGKYGKARAGHIVNTGRTPPYGYDYVSEPHKGSLVINEVEAPIVRLIFRLYTEGAEDGELPLEFPAHEPLKMKTIARALYAMRIPTKSDNRLVSMGKAQPYEWHRSTIQVILQNKVYIGQWVYGRRSTSGREKITVPVPAIVDKKTFAKAQRLCAMNTKYSPRNRKHPYLISSLAICGECGCRMYGHTGSVPISYYVCASQLWGARSYRPKCNSPYFRVSITDEWVWNAVAAMLKQPDNLAIGIRRMQQDVASRNEPIFARVTQIDKDLAGLVNKDNRLLSAYIAGKFTEAQIDAEKQAIADERLRLTEERARLQQQMTASVTDDDLLEFSRWCAEIAAGLDEANFATKRKYLELLGVEVVLKEGREPEVSISVNGLRVTLGL